MLRRRERSDPRAYVGLWNGLAVLPIAGVFLACGLLLPDTRSRALDALICAVFGVAVTALAVYLDRLIHRGHRRTRWWGMSPPILSTWFTVFTVVNEILPDAAVLAGAIAYVAVAVTGQMLSNRWQRGERARRRQEIAELAAKF